jgi:hypothetical protein
MTDNEHLITGHCPICADPTFGTALCWVCAVFREYSVPAKALCDGLHRGRWPERKQPTEPTPEVEGP